MRRLLACGFLLNLLGGCAVGDIDIDQAKRIAQSEIDAKNQQEKRVINPDLIDEKDYGWVFREVDSRYLKNPSMDYWIIGIGPIVVDRKGNIYSVPLFMSWYGKIDEYMHQQIQERYGRPNP